MSIWETPEEKQDEILQKIFSIIERYEMGMPAILLLESVKPLLWVGGEFAKMALGPFMLAFWQDGFTYINTLEERQNVENLIKMIEDKAKKDKEKNRQNKNSEETS